MKRGVAIVILRLRIWVVRVIKPCADVFAYTIRFLNAIIVGWEIV